MLALSCLIHWRLNRVVLFFSKLKHTVYRTFCISALVYALYILQDKVVCLEERKSATLIFIQDPSVGPIFQRPLLFGSLRESRLIGLVTIQVICTFPKMMNWETCYVSSNWVFFLFNLLFKLNLHHTKRIHITTWRNKHKNSWGYIYVWIRLATYNKRKGRWTVDGGWLNFAGHMAKSKRLARG